MTKQLPEHKTSFPVRGELNPFFYCLTLQSTETRVKYALTNTHPTLFVSCIALFYKSFTILDETLFAKGTHSPVLSSMSFLLTCNIPKTRFWVLNFKFACRQSKERTKQEGRLYFDLSRYL